MRCPPSQLWHSQGLATVLYNDEPPDPYTTKGETQRNSRVTFETAHAKGVLAYDGVGAGFWLIHSVPKFPDLTLPSFTWTASTTYGQSFMCLSLDLQSVDVAAFQLRHVYAEIFSSNAPEWLPSMSPNMSLLVNRCGALTIVVAAFCLLDFVSCRCIAPDPTRAARM